MQYTLISRIVLFFAFALLNFCASAETYTMNSSGDYQDEANWDSYPGTELMEGDIIVIDVNFMYNFTLTMWGGHLIFTESAFDMNVNFLEVYNDSTIEFQGDNINLIIE